MVDVIACGVKKLFPGSIIIDLWRMFHCSSHKITQPEVSQSSPYQLLVASIHYEVLVYFRLVSVTNCILLPLSPAGPPLTFTHSYLAVTHSMLLPGAVAQVETQHLRRESTAGVDNSFRLLLREGACSRIVSMMTCSTSSLKKFDTHQSYQTGIIDEIPTSICEKLRKPTAGAQGKNVILVVGDGMGWGTFLFFRNCKHFIILGD